MVGKPTKIGGEQTTLSIGGMPAIRIGSNVAHASFGKTKKKMQARSTLELIGCLGYNSVMNPEMSFGPGEDST